MEKRWQKQLIEIFPMDSIIQPLYIWGKEFNQENIVGLAFKAFLCNSKLQFIFGRLHLQVASIVLPKKISLFSCSYCN